MDVLNSLITHILEDTSIQYTTSLTMAFNYCPSPGILHALSSIDLKPLNLLPPLGMVLLPGLVLLPPIPT